MESAWTNFSATSASAIQDGQVRPAIRTSTNVHLDRAETTVNASITSTIMLALASPVTRASSANTRLMTAHQILVRTEPHA